MLQHSDMFYGDFLLNCLWVRRVKNVNHNFKHEIKLAGRDWAQDFIWRNRELRVRKSEPVTAIRILAFRGHLDLWLVLRCTSLGLINLQCNWEWILMCTETCCGHSVVKKRLRFPQVSKKDASLSRGGPVGSIYVCSKSEWMNEDLFVIWLKTFVSYVQSSIQNPTLNHSSHVSIRSYNFYQNNGIIMISISPHTSDRMRTVHEESFVCKKFLL